MHATRADIEYAKRKALEIHFPKLAAQEDANLHKNINSDERRRRRDINGVVNSHIEVVAKRRNGLVARVIDPKRPSVPAVFTSKKYQHGNTLALIKSRIRSKEDWKLGWLQDHNGHHVIVGRIVRQLQRREPKPFRIPIH